MARLGGLVVAGGAGRRFGGPKALARLDGERLVDRAVRVLQPWCDGPVLVSSRAERGVVPHAAGVVDDEPGPACSLLAVASGLAALDGCDGVLVLAVDLPWAAPVLARLVAHPARGAVGADAGGRLQPLCARYPRAAALHAAGLALRVGERRLRLLPERLALPVVRAAGGELKDVTTPADLALDPRSRGAAYTPAARRRGPGDGEADR